MPYLDATSPALYLSTRLGRSGQRLGDTGVAFQAPHIFTAAQTGKPAPAAPKPISIAPPISFKPVTIPAFPGAPKITISVPTLPIPSRPVAPPPSGSPQGQIPNGPSNIPVPYMTDSGGGPVIMPSSGGGGGGGDAGALPSGMETAGDGSGGGVSFFASLPWWAWLALGVAGYYVAKRVTA